MRKRIIIVLLIFAAFFGGCNKTVKDVMESFGAGKTGEDEAPEDEWKAVKLDKETRFFNDYLGFSYAVPKGWWLYEVNEDNLSQSRGGITGDVAMDIYFNKYKDYSFSGAWLMTFGNLEKSEMDNHLGFDLDTRSIEGISGMAAYMKYFEDYMLESEEGEKYSLTDSQQIAIKGKSFELRNYLVTFDDYRSYNILTLSCQVKEGNFLNIKADYWADNTKAKNAIIESVTKALEFY